MQIAPEHAERQRIAPRVNMKKWLLLHRIALQGGNVPERDPEFALVIEANLADAALSFTD